MEKGECIMEQQKNIKIAGMALTLLGAGITLITNELDDRKLDLKVAEKVAEALAKK